ncbi:type 4a pilus biogenesis protein PilO [Halopseudomonas sp.]|uniref:type 4a pilus biogenesis protein PilO n=1 Tax=Halopseudomonas sp. TaxID=2901191 RepID=UPI00300100B8
MSFSQSMESLKKVDLNDLDFNNIGSWPGALKVIVCALVLGVLLGLGYQFHLKDLQISLERVEAQEVALRKEFEDKSFRAANLEDYRAQLAEIEERFSGLLKQLPKDSEVPGLLEDITQMGLNSGLEFESITLSPEVAKQFYVELPIDIVVRGSYHDLATFVSSVAGLPRIVTLNDFTIRPAGESNPDLLVMNIVAKTYRYNDVGEGSSDE